MPFVDRENGTSLDVHSLVPIKVSFLSVRLIEEIIIKWKFNHRCLFYWMSVLILSRGALTKCYLEGMCNFKPPPTIREGRVEYLITFLCSIIAIWAYFHLPLSGLVCKSLSFSATSIAKLSLNESNKIVYQNYLCA